MQYKQSLQEKDSINDIFSAQYRFKKEKYWG